MSRRAFIAATSNGGVTLVGCGWASGLIRPLSPPRSGGPHTGRTISPTLIPQPVFMIDLGSTVARMLAYGNMLSGLSIRADVGDELAVTVGT